MGKQSNRKFYFVFAAWTFLAVGIVATVVTILQIESINAQTETEAASSMNRQVLPALDVDAEDITATDFAGFYENAPVLLGQEDIGAIRIWNSDLDIVAEVSADAAAAAPAQLADVRSAFETGAVKRKSRTAEGEVLTSFVRLSDTGVVEIQRDYDPIASSIGASQWRIALIGLAGTVIAMVFLQTILWAATRGMREEYDRLAHLYRTGQAMRSTLDMNGTLEQLVRDAAEYTGTRLGLATLLEEGTAELFLRASYDSQIKATVQHSRRIDLWYLRRCAITGETVISAKEDVPYERILGHEIGDSRKTSVLNVPIPGRDGAVGVLTLICHPDRRRIRSADIHVVEEMAAQSGMAIEQVALFTKARNHAEELELSYDGTLRVLMAALDTKDAVTQGHSERVARMTVSLAKEMGVPDEELVDLERGALLHDIGKIGVPDAVLQKPSQLDDDEWEAMEKHPLHAGLMVSKVSFLEGAMPIVLYHHERYDGAGYPFKLEGDAIPLGARIFTVVDSYDAMTWDRPYRKAMPSETALAEIERHSGSQFDPKVVEAFVRLIRRMDSARERAA